MFRNFNRPLKLKIKKKIEVQKRIQNKWNNFQIKKKKMIIFTENFKIYFNMCKKKYFSNV